MMRDLLTNNDGLGLAALIGRGDVSVSESIEAALDLIAELNPTMNAVTVDMTHEARRQVDRGLASGPFRGVPILLKDVAAASYAGAPCTLSSRLLENNIADHDSEIVVRFKRSGAVIVGRTNLPNFGPSVATESRFRGPARNPWNLQVMTGGSSGGSAAAVASRMVPIAHATDAAGSLRIPAAHCGVFGLKTTRGRVPAGPKLGELVSGFGTAHVISRSIRDSAAMLDSTSGFSSGEVSYPPSPGKSYLALLEAPPPRLRIALCKRAFDGNGIHDDCRAAIDYAGQIFETLGHSVEEDAPAFAFERIRRNFPLAHGANLWPLVKSLLSKLGRRPEPEDIEPAALHWAETGSRFDAAAYANAIKELHSVARDISRFFDRFDVLVTPTTPVPPPPLGTITMMEPDFERYCDDLFRHAVFTVPFNCTGQPAATLPLWWTKGGLPVGVQCVARFGREDILLQLARSVAEVEPFENRMPTGVMQESR